MSDRSAVFTGIVRDCMTIKLRTYRILSFNRGAERLYDNQIKNIGHCPQTKEQNVDSRGRLPEGEDKIRWNHELRMMGMIQRHANFRTTYSNTFYEMHGGPWKALEFGVGGIPSRRWPRHHIFAAGDAAFFCFISS